MHIILNWKELEIPRTDNTKGPKEKRQLQTEGQVGKIQALMHLEKYRATFSADKTPFKSTELQYSE